MIEFEIVKILELMQNPHEKLQFLQELLNFIQKKAAHIQERMQANFVEVIENEEQENRETTEQSETVSQDG